MKPISLKDIALFCNTQTSLSGEITRISIDSRDIDENTLFVALIGERFDAHDFIEDVLSKGAKAVVASKKIVDDDRIILVEDTGKALLRIAHGYRKTCDIPFIALTGSVGKTTTKGMVFSVVNRKLNAMRTSGNLNNEIGVPKTIFTIEAEHEAAVIEMGMNHFGEIETLSKTVEPNMACITNVGSAHIENLGSREGILKAKTEIVAGMKKGSALIINGDNDMLATYNNENYRIIRFGIDGENLDIKAENIVSQGDGTTFTAVFGDSKADVFVPSVGVHNVYNALCAICVGLELGYSLEESALGVADYVPEGMRQKITVIKGITFIEDCYNANLDSMKASLEALKTINKGNAYAVLGDMLELGVFSESAHRQVGAKAALIGCKAVFTYGDLSKYIVCEAKKNGVHAERFADKEEIASTLCNCLEAGDTVLFKGSRGMKLEDVFNSLYKKIQ